MVTSISVKSESMIFRPQKNKMLHRSRHFKAEKQPPNAKTFVAFAALATWSLQKRENFFLRHTKSLKFDSVYENVYIFWKIGTISLYATYNP